jgi:hypothetical protein
MLDHPLIQKKYPEGISVISWHGLMQRKLSGRCDIQEEFKEKISHLYKNNQLMVQVLILGMVLC